MPKGVWWDVTENKLVRGDRTFCADFTLDEFPVYYKGGAVIPFYPVQRSVVKNPTEITLCVVPGADGKGSFYEDDGTDNEYTGDAWARTVFTQTRTDSKIILNIGARQGSFEGMPQKRTWEVQMLGISDSCDLQNITVDNEPVDASSVAYNAQTGLLEVRILVDDLAKPVSLCVPIKKGESQVEENDRDATLQYDSRHDAVSVTMPHKASVVSLVVTTVEGACVARQKAHSVSSLLLPLSALPTGTYVCQAIVDGKQVVKKIVKK